MPKAQHRAAIVKPSELAELIRDIDNTVSGNYCTVEALKLIPRVFQRPKEICLLKWDYVDFEAELIRIAKQVIKQLRELRQYTGYTEYVFPNHRDSSKPISKNNSLIAQCRAKIGLTSGLPH